MKANGGKRIKIYLTDNCHRFEEQLENFIAIRERTRLDPALGTMIVVDPKRQYQEIHGFGASFTDTAALVMAEMPRNTLQQAMVRLFDKEDGIGLSLIRNCIGASDFSPEYYTYDDMPEGEEDWELLHFNFDRAMDKIIPLTKWARALNPELLLFLAPWSPPLWMKDKHLWQSEKSPELRRDCYEVYARYLVKSMDAYEKSGLPIYAVSAQNEPYALLPWPGMHWNREDMILFVNDYLRPALDRAGVNARILNLDHNFNFDYEANAIMQATGDNAQGAAYHWYAGRPEQMRSTAELFPDKLIYVTEASYDNPDTTDKLVFIAQNIVRSLRAGANGYLMWNMALDPDGGPAYHGINAHCSGLLTCNRDACQISYGKDYYALAHFSKCIRQNARRIFSSDTAGTDFDLVNLAVENPDGSMVVIIVNAGKEQEHFCKVVTENLVIEVAVPSNGVVTLFWEPEEGE